MALIIISIRFILLLTTCQILIGAQLSIPLQIYARVNFKKVF